jgi:hypothetical protein
MDAVSAYGAVLVGKLQDLLDGKLAAPNLPADFAAAMPPAAVATEVGPVLGTVVVPVEAWALAYGGLEVVKLRDQLKAGGVTNLYVRRYAVQAVPGQVLEATAFQFNDVQAASDWEWNFIRPVAAHGPVFDAGDTGMLRAFTMTGGAYELQFAKGSLVCDVMGLAPNGAPDARLKPLVLKTAEEWYKSAALK